jgi:hypothetical protein
VCTTRNVAYAQPSSLSLDAVTDLQRSSIQDHTFDEGFRPSSEYPKTLSEILGPEDSLYEATSLIENSSSLSTTERLRRHVATHASYRDAEVLSITASFAASVAITPEDRHADKVKKSVLLTDDFGENQLLSALLDTGANCNFISEGTLSALSLKDATRKLRPPEEISVAGGSITAIHVVKVKWRFVNETAFYTHMFYVVPGLEHEIVIGRTFIFEHGLLTNNLELHPPNLLENDERVPELLIMGISRLSKGKFHEILHLGESADSHKAAKKDQDERTAAKEKKNQEQRDKEANEIRERLAAQASSSTAPANASGSASSSGPSNTTK